MDGCVPPDPRTLRQVCSQFVGTDTRGCNKQSGLFLDFANMPFSAFFAKENGFESLLRDLRWRRNILVQSLSPRTSFRPSGESLVNGALILCLA